MRNRYLPTEIEISGKTYPINQKGDYGMVLDVLEVLSDKELTDQEKSLTALLIFYDFNLPDTEEALQIAGEKMIEFINCGEKNKPSNKKPLMNWNKDFPILVAPINRVLQYDIRERQYVHWWTVVSAYMEIGECTFQTVVGIRQKKQKHKKLEKWEEEYYRENRDKVDLDIDFSSEEEQFFKDLLDGDLIE